MFHRFTVDDNRTNDSSITTEVDAPFLLHQLEKRTTEERYDWCKHTPICASQRSLELHGGILSPLSNLDLGRLDSLQQLSIRWDQPDEVDDIVIGTIEGRRFFDLEAIHRAMLHWLRKLMGLTVLVASDNSIVVSYINKQS
ncbi:hypothetical protein NP493_1499g00012 [Ridgeia piscesae]|uniref:Uncharacterized protein n=1 Tax=Ridgeia piscesae TaxID=27915 RepID=A0AAD9K0S8_RIDPI|nr:hypothetical protein NP493_1499g00012 [Ridgeia piscesae]